MRMMDDHSIHPLTADRGPTHDGTRWAKLWLVSLHVQLSDHFGQPAAALVTVRVTITCEQCTTHAGTYHIYADD
jgi:hypothetical protein